MQDDSKGKPRFKPRSGFSPKPKGGFRGGPKGGGSGFHKRPHGPPRSSEPAEDDGLVRLFGFHPVEAALRNPDRVLLRLMATENAAHRLADAIAARGLTPENVVPARTRSSPWGGYGAPGAPARDRAAARTRS